MNIKKTWLFVMVFIILLSGCGIFVNVNSNININHKIQNSNLEYQPICIAKGLYDKTALGTYIAVNDNFVALGDTKANKVILFTRNSEENWQKFYEIYPPKGTISQKIGHGFGSNLIMNDKTLVIQAYDYQWEFLNKEPAEIYVVELSKDKVKNQPIKVDISYEGSYLTRINSLALFDNNLAVGTRTTVKNGSIKSIELPRFYNNIYIVDLMTGKIVNEINEPQFKHVESYQLTSLNNSLLFVDRTVPWEKSITRIYSDGKLEKVFFDKKQVEEKETYNDEQRFRTQKATISGDMYAISRKGMFMSDIVFFPEFPNISKFKILTTAADINAYKAYALTISGFYTRVRRGENASESYFAYKLFEKTENTMIQRASIAWGTREKNEPYESSPIYKPTGVVGEKELFLEVGGDVVVLPIEKLPEKYVIEVSVCGE